MNESTKAKLDALLREHDQSKVRSAADAQESAAKIRGAMKEGVDHLAKVVTPVLTAFAQHLSTNGRAAAVTEYGKGSVNRVSLSIGIKHHLWFEVKARPDRHTVINIKQTGFDDPSPLSQGVEMPVVQVTADVVENMALEFIKRVLPSEGRNFA